MLVHAPNYASTSAVPPLAKQFLSAGYRVESSSDTNFASASLSAMPQPRLNQGSGKPIVLLIEDNSGDVFLVEEALREHHVDCELVVCRDGEEAILFFEHLDGDASVSQPQLVLLDLNLPKIPGHKVLQSIRGSARSATLPVVIVTSSASQADLERNRKFGASAYFQKPSSLTEFMKIGELIGSFLKQTHS